MLDSKWYKYTLRMCNAYGFFTATVVTRTRLNVTLYVHCIVLFRYHDGVYFQTLSAPITV